MRSGEGSPGSQVRESLGEPGGVVHLEDVCDQRLGQPPVAVGDQVSGPSGTAVAVLSRRSTLSSLLPPVIAPARAAATSRRPVARADRDRQVAVGVSNGGSRQQRLS